MVHMTQQSRVMVAAARRHILVRILASIHVQALMPRYLFERSMFGDHGEVFAVGRVKWAGHRESV